jgi:thiol-disulfide isomerase/thioredoxin
MTPGLIVVVAVLVLGTGIGWWHRRADGRFRSVDTGATLEASADGTLPIAGTQPAEAKPAPEVLDGELLTALGVGPARATLLQFSSAFCAPCRALRRISSEVAAMVPGVQHVEIDAESHLDAVRALGIWRTPTLLVLDADGRVVKRATGVPGKPQLIAVLGEALPD